MKTVMAALFIATKMPRLNYLWGGGHDSISTGINSSWGTPKEVTAGGDNTTGTMQPNSLDCSGYVSWSLKNGGYNIDKPKVVSELDKLGTNTPITETKEVKTGDLASMNGHIGMVVNIENNNITVSHCSGSGSGINLTTIDTNTGLVVDDATNPERIGKKYFEKIVSIDYAS